MTDWKKERRKVVSHSMDFSLPHSMLYRMVKNPDAVILRNTTVNVNRHSTTLYNLPQSKLRIEMKQEAEILTNTMYSKLYEMLKNPEAVILRKTTVTTYISVIQYIHHKCNDIHYTDTIHTLHT